MKNNTATNKLGKLVIRARFEAITGASLNRDSIFGFLVGSYASADDRFRAILKKEVFKSETGFDLRKTSTWEALASAIATYEALSIVETNPDPEKCPRGTNHSLSTVIVSKGQESESRGTNDHSLAVDETPLEKWHLDDPDWRDARVMQMGEWHPYFRKIESGLKRRLHPFTSVLKEYSTLLLSETTDDADDLLRHLHEEVVAYLANKLVEAVDDAWKEVTNEVIRPNSPVREFEELIEECKQMMGSLAVGV